MPICNPKVVHIKSVKLGNASDYVFIGRGSKWGNPFVMGRDGRREDVIRKYKEWICTQPQLMNSIHELKGKNLVCFCAPKPCHGDVLLKLANNI